MTMERTLRLLAGSFALLFLGLGYWANPYWYWGVALVGANLLQSGFTDWCPMMSFLERLGLPKG